MEGQKLTKKLTEVVKKSINRFSKKNKKCQKRDDRILSMKEIKKRAEQVSKQSFIQGWIKAEPKYGNQIILI